MADAAERKEKNERIFREANEQIHEAAVELLEARAPAPFICECSDTACRDVLLLSLDDYTFARADDARFILADGHPHGEAELLRSGEGWAIWAKAGAD